MMDFLVVDKLPRNKDRVKALQTFPEVMNLSELKDFLGIGYASAVGLLTSGEIPCRHFNRQWLIYKQDVIDWVRAPGIKDNLERK
jgi:hypothetical protein